VVRRGWGCRGAHSRCTHRSRWVRPSPITSDPLPRGLLGAAGPGSCRPATLAVATEAFAWLVHVGLTRMPLQHLPHEPEQGGHGGACGGDEGSVLVGEHVALREHHAVAPDAVVPILVAALRLTALTLARRLERPRPLGRG